MLKTILINENRLSDSEHKIFYGLCDDSDITQLICDLVDSGCRFELVYNLDRDYLTVINYGGMLTKQHKRNLSVMLHSKTESTRQYAIRQLSA